MSTTPIAHLEFYKTYPGKPVSTWTITGADQLNQALEWYRQQADDVLPTEVHLTFEDDSQLAFPAGAYPEFVRWSVAEGVTYRVMVESEYDTGWEELLTTTDYSNVVPLVQRHQHTVRVTAEKDDGVDVLDLRAFIHQPDTTSLELPYNKPIDFEEKRPATRPLGEGESGDDPVAILREAFSNVNAVLENQRFLMDSLRQQETELRELRRRQRRPLHEDDGNAWLHTLDESETHVSVAGYGEDLLAREEAKWRQQFDVDGRTVRTGSPVQRLNKGGHSKEEIIMHIERRRGHGAPHDVLLPRSGFWLRFRPPRLDDLVTLQYQLSQLKINIGNITKGLAFSNLSQTLKSTVMDFCLQFVTHATCVYRTPTDLKEKIDLGDMDIVLWGLMCTIYPRGFPYSHACVADPAKCQHVTREILNLNNLFWMDESAFTKKQREFLAKRPWDRPHTDEEIQAYRDDHARGRSRIVWFEGGIGLEMKIPNVYEYEVSGQSWITGLVEMTNSAYNEPATGSSRMKYIDPLAMATTGRQYAHMVKAIWEQSDDDSEPVFLGDDRDLIDTVMATNFATDDDFDKLFDAVKALIDDAVIGVIAVPSFDCPQCDTPVAKTFHQRFPHLVALDVLNTFFTLHSRKLRN